MPEPISLSFFNDHLRPLAPLHLDFRDDSAAHAGHAGAASGGGHYAICIVSECFNTLNRLQRHRLVYNYLSDFIPHPIHALNIEALSPDEWHVKNWGASS